jgi:hypothetical protein
MKTIEVFSGLSITYRALNDCTGIEYLQELVAFKMPSDPLLDEACAGQQGEESSFLEGWAFHSFWMQQVAPCSTQAWLPPPNLTYMSRLALKGIPQARD